MTAWYIEANFRNIVFFPQKMPSKTFTDYSESSGELKYVLIFYMQSAWTVHIAIVWFCDNI
jgi:hypothetical protein